MLNIMNIARLITTAVLLAALFIFVPIVSADGGQKCVGQYGQTVDCVTKPPKKCVGQYGQSIDCNAIPSPTPHTPVQSGIGDFINPLTMGLLSLSASGAFYLRSKRSARN